MQCLLYLSRILLILWIVTWLSTSFHDIGLTEDFEKLRRFVDKFGTVCKRGKFKVNIGISMVMRVTKNSRQSKIGRQIGGREYKDSKCVWLFGSGCIGRYIHIPIYCIDMYYTDMYCTDMYIYLPTYLPTCQTDLHTLFLIWWSSNTVDAVKIIGFIRDKN